MENEKKKSPETPLQLSDSNDITIDTDLINNNSATRNTSIVRDTVLESLGLPTSSNANHTVKFESRSGDTTLTLETKIALVNEVHIKSWKLIANISSKLIDFDESLVSLECLLDKEERIYEEREFDIALFNGYNLEIGKLFKVCIYQRENQRMIDIKDDSKLISTDDFPEIDLYTPFKNIKLNKPH
jgi:hypothetical protein